MLPQPNLDQLHRVQTTLAERLGRRDSKNIGEVGFAPGDRSKLAQLDRSTDQITWPITVQVQVASKRRRVAEAKRVRPIETVRLLDRGLGTYDEIQLTTDVVQTRAIVPTGVNIATRYEMATTAVVARWTTVRDAPPPVDDQDGGSAWRWGLLTVSHLFTGRGDTPVQSRARIDRMLNCGPATDIGGRVAARGRIPGGPDIALVETGRDRLWLSGFLRRIDAPPRRVSNDEDQSRWTAGGVAGTLHRGDPPDVPIQWNAFYPEMTIDGLGRLRQVVRFEVTDRHEARPLRPGTSGGVAVARGGSLIGMQVAAGAPDFRVGYLQTFDASLAWLTKRIGAKQFHLVAVL